MARRCTATRITCPSKEVCVWHRSLQISLQIMERVDVGTAWVARQTIANETVPP